MRQGKASSDGRFGWVYGVLPIKFCSKSFFIAACHTQMPNDTRFGRCYDLYHLSGKSKPFTAVTGFFDPSSKIGSAPVTCLRRSKSLWILESRLEAELC